MKARRNIPRCGSCGRLALNTKGRPVCRIWLSKRDPDDTCGLHTARAETREN